MNQKDSLKDYIPDLELILIFGLAGLIVDNMNIFIAFLCIVLIENGVSKVVILDSYTPTKRILLYTLRFVIIFGTLLLFKFKFIV